jgi:plastocyanin
MNHEDEHASASQEAAEAPVSIEGAPELAVTGGSFSFEPVELTINAGQLANIALTSTDVLHDFNVENHGFHLAVDPGETAVGGLTVEEAGTYTIYCSVPGHREAGMKRPSPWDRPPSSCSGSPTPRCCWRPDEVDHALSPRLWSRPATPARCCRIPQ